MMIRLGESAGWDSLPASRRGFTDAKGSDRALLDERRFAVRDDSMGIRHSAPGRDAKT